MELSSPPNSSGHKPMCLYTVLKLKQMNSTFNTGVYFSVVPSLVSTTKVVSIVTIGYQLNEH